MRPSSRLRTLWAGIGHELAALPSTVARTSRSLRRAPGFVAIATLSLGAALGLSTSVFALIDAMRHPESPFRAADQLYDVGFYRMGAISGPTRHDVDEALANLSGVSERSSYRYAYEPVETNNGGERRGVVYTRPGFFKVLGLQPRIGHLLSPADEVRGDVAMVSDALWRSRYNNRSRVDGATLAIGDKQYTIVGVLPPRAEFGENFGTHVWVPDTRSDSAGAGDVVLRIPRAARDTVLVERQLIEIAHRWSKQFLSAREQPYSFRLSSMKPNPLRLGDYHRAIIGAAICILIIACANVAALMLARGMVRRRDYALRLALGASRGEISREVVMEVALLALVGCVSGALIATWAVGLITRAMPAELVGQGFAQPQWSVRVFAASAAAVLVSIAIAGGFPAWQASRTDPMGPLKESGGGTTGRAGTRFRWLVMAELALSMMLVMGASLMVKSAVRMAAYDFGYDARKLITAESYMPRAVLTDHGWAANHDTLSDSAKVELATTVFSRLDAVPGIRSVAKLSACTRKGGGVVTSDRTVEGAAAGYVPNYCHAGSAGLFTTLGIPMADGRDFIEGDDVKGSIILSERTARHLYPHERAVGRMVKLGDLASNLPWLPVVGVVRERNLDFNLFPEAGRDTSEQIYAMVPDSRADISEIIVRPEPGATDAQLAIWKVLRSALPPHSVWHVKSYVENYELRVQTEQFLSILFVLLGLVSLGLGAAGLFSVISYIAGQRMREFAVRIALGATKQNILRLVMTEALMMALGGTAVGAGLGMWAGFLLWGAMWGVYPVDAQALIAGEATLLLITMLACLVPALRATRANPVDVLRAA